VATASGIDVHYEVTVRGLNTVIQHFDAIASLTGELLFWGADRSGELVRDYAKANHPWTNRTFDTEKSIHHNVFTTPDSVGMEAGPTTFYAPFLEFGTIKAKPFPFMIPALDFYTPSWLAYCLDVAGLADNFKWPSPDYASHERVRSGFSQIRSLLYTSAKALGDVAVLGGREIISPVRASLYAGARALGDISAVTGGTVGSRISRRLVGRITASGLGVGRVSMFGGNTYSSQVGGTAGPRIYSRIAGRNTRFIVNRSGFSG
jgi:HK97 gp10 family phage protein